MKPETDSRLLRAASVQMESPPGIKDASFKKRP